MSETDWTHIENILLGLGFFVFFMTLIIAAAWSDRK